MNNSKISVRYWSDIACPYCYIGATRMKKAMETVGLDPNDLEMKAFQLNPQAPLKTEATMLDQFALGHAISRERARDQFNQMEAMAATDGLKLNAADAIPTNTMSAHRLIKWAKATADKETVSRLIARFYKVYFEDNDSIADYKVLLNAVKEVGLPSQDAINVLTSTEYEIDVQSDLLAAQQNNVQSVPFFVLNDKYVFSGAQPYEQIVAALRRVMEEASETE
ncbi:DsbA family oxidoreductase [Veillonella criceti]|uniref:Protein-disulfide isomerase n=1 Tax=Veillonella criceti TaxID=103891 RepID=A0A380NIP5_9FIRM|nr:DsbA family oxidoreductase [Veillonella criceti]SUP41694.1 Protein-disulfide isomerase [Veillonella criceti]